MNLARYCSYWAQMRGDRPAAVFKDTQLTWGQLNDQAEAVAATLQSMGVAKGDRVGCLLNNCMEWVVMWSAILKAGAILVPLNPRYGDVELREITALVDCTVIASTADHIARFAPDVANRALDLTAKTLFPLKSGGIPVSIEAAIAGGGVATDVQVDAEDIAVITFTSGTSGVPKGAMLSHRAIQAVDACIIRTYRYSCEEQVLLLAPFAFTGGCISVYSPTYIVGGCIHIEESPDPERALATIIREGITALTGVPILWERMASSPQFSTADLSSLTSAATGGAPVPQSLLERYLSKGIRIRQVYGCTEASGLISAPNEQHALDKPWACGAPLPSLELQIVDMNGTPCVTGEVGEIVLRGPQLFSGYWNAPGATQDAWRNGWYHTGDLGRLDEMGHVQITDRKKNIVISGGVNIYPAEVERAMSAIAGVDEVVAFGIPDSVWGERVVAVVHGVLPVDPKDIMQQARSALGAYKTPKEIIVSTHPLPRTSSGKVLRAQFTQLYEQLDNEPRAVAEARN